MKIKCIYNTAKYLSPDLYNNKTSYNQDVKFNLKLDHIYPVYAIRVYQGYVWYSICKESDDFYSLSYPADLFTIVDQRLSKYWIVSTLKDEHDTDLSFLMTYPEWANNLSHYSYVVDGETEEEIEHQKIFQKYKKLMYLEFPDPEIEMKAASLDDGWVMCPICIDAWEPKSIDGMIICPKCKNVMHNPFYQPLEYFKLDDE